MFVSYDVQTDSGFLDRPSLYRAPELHIVLNVVLRFFNNKYLDALFLEFLHYYCTPNSKYAESLLHLELNIVVSGVSPEADKY